MKPESWKQKYQRGPFTGFLLQRATTLAMNKLVTTPIGTAKPRESPLLTRYSLKQYDVLGTECLQNITAPTCTSLA